MSAPNFLRALAPRSAAKSRGKEPQGSASAAEGQLSPDKALVSGAGGLTFTANGPPGSARITRLPFYPTKAADSFTGGILDDGDDPILAIELLNNSAVNVPVTSPVYRMEVRAWDSGTYRVIGMVTNFQDAYTAHECLGQVPVPSTTKNVGINVGNFQVYNGAQLFVIPPDRFLDARTFRVLPGGNAFGNAAFNYMRQIPLTFNNRGRQFVGLRGTPVIERNTTLSLDVTAFANEVLARGKLVVPVTVSLVIDILEDRVFGDVRVPSPASRGGALVKVGLERVQRARGARLPHQEILRTARYLPPGDR